MSSLIGHLPSKGRFLIFKRKQIKTLGHWDKCTYIYDFITFCLSQTCPKPVPKLAFCPKICHKFEALMTFHCNTCFPNVMSSTTISSCHRHSGKCARFADFHSSIHLSYITLSQRLSTLPCVFSTHFAYHDCISLSYSAFRAKSFSACTGWDVPPCYSGDVNV